MPDLLREQFPHFRPIVEAFGYRNLEFEGWEADDVIATIATRADEAAVRTCVVSTDRDAFQLCTENICLMMTPRGVADVHVYTPDRVELRYGIRPEQVPDFIGLKGDTSDNIPGIPGIGDKTAGQLVAQYGSLEAVIEHADELSPRAAKSVTEHAEQARNSKLLATMRRDLPLDVDPSELVSAPPDRSTLKEIFRRFEFRGLLGRVDTLDEALPAPPPPASRPRRSPGGRALSTSLCYSTQARLGLASQTDGSPPPPGTRSSSSTPCSATFAASRPGDARRARREAAAPRRGAGRRHVDRRLSRRSRPRRLRAGRPRARARPGALAEPAAEEETTALVRRAEAVRRLAPLLRVRVREWGSEQLYDEIELPLTAVLADMEDAGIRIDTYRMGEITARLTERVEELEAQAYEHAGEEFQLGSTQQLARILFEKLELTSGRKGKTGYSTDARVLRAIRDDHPLVPVVEEWRELTKLLNTYLLPLPELIAERDGRLHTTINQAVAATGRLSTTNPNLQSIPVRTELGRRIRSAFVSADGTRLLSADYSQVELRILAHVSGEPVLREAFARNEDIHTRHGLAGLRHPTGGAHARPARHGEDGQLRDHLRDLVLRALGEPRDPARRGAGADRHLSRPLPARPRVDRAHDRRRRRGRLRDDAPRPPPRDSRAPRREPPDALARRAPRRQHRDAGDGRGRDQGRDGAHPRAAPRARAAPLGSCSRCTTSSCSRCPRSRRAP